MIQSFTITNYLGDSIKLELRRPENSGFLVKSVTGLGPVQANISTTEMATNDGSSFNSARLNQRNIVFQFVFLDTIHGESIEDLRQKSYKYFPLKKKLEVIVEADNRCAKIEGYVESNEPDIFSSQEGTQISIICPDPYFYSAGENNTNVTVFNTVEPMLEFPFANESTTSALLEMGVIKNQTEQLIVYSGDSEIGLTITIHAIGKASNISIYNINTRETMRIDTNKLETLTGSGIVAGDEIIICTVKGEKSIILIRDGKTTNILNCLDKNADWLKISKGDNIFAYTAESGSDNLQFKIENRIAYEGL